MKDRRLRRRVPTILEGRIQIEGRESDIECTVRDLSDSGARIFLHQPLELPDEFILSIPKRGLSSNARVMWSRDRRHGVMLLRDLPVAEQSTSDIFDPRIHTILKDARSQLAQIMGLSEDSIRLNFDVDPLSRDWSEE
ncbi:PilZ domain-containing protein [Microvirga sp. BT688]|uniref:PilZ domain-containing protein n=1 Tax=Microvirga sp. TaxID=1873136 RepID=UPI0016850A4D|nr:PilZ domain-containing protein [Microvirga sp.]MBD2746514.1 PilZ domain-containing protein [Microvirga sp.]